MCRPKPDEIYCMGLILTRQQAEGGVAASAAIFCVGNVTGTGVNEQTGISGKIPRTVARELVKKIGAEGPIV